MTRTIHGKIHGRIIELDEDPGAAEGQEVEVQLKVIEPPKPHAPMSEGLARVYEMKVDCRGVAQGSGMLCGEWLNPSGTRRRRLHPGAGLSAPRPGGEWRSETEGALPISKASSIRS